MELHPSNFWIPVDCLWFVVVREAALHSYLSGNLQLDSYQLSVVSCQLSLALHSRPFGDLHRRRLFQTQDVQP